MRIRLLPALLLAMCLLSCVAFAQEMVPWAISWDAVKLDETGKPLTSPVTYRVETRDPGGAWRSLATVSTTTYAASTSAKCQDFRVFAIAAGAESVGSNVVCGKLTKAIAVAPWRVAPNSSYPTRPTRALVNGALGDANGRVAVGDPCDCKTRLDTTVTYCSVAGRPNLATPAEDVLPAQTVAVCVP